LSLSLLTSTTRISSTLVSTGETPTRTHTRVQFLPTQPAEVTALSDSFEPCGRNLRSVWAAVETLYDYKVGMICPRMHLWRRNSLIATLAQVTLARTKNLDELHERVAKRWYDVCCTNAGLYIKIGQQVATMNHILPPPFLKHFATMNDQAPSVDMSVVIQQPRRLAGSPAGAAQWGCSR
jgi:hypothetical protein